MNKLVSVIIPCYNGENFIERAMQSVREQDYPYIELIVVDDGSTDRSREKILLFKQNFDGENRELKYIHQENRGPGGAIDTGLKQVSGEYLTLLDADDLYLPDSIPHMVAYLEAHPDYVGVRSNGFRVKGETRFLFASEACEKQEGSILTDLIRGTAYNWAGSYMVKTAPLFVFYPDRTIYPSRFGQNLQILCPVAKKGYFGYLDEPLMCYLLQETSLSQEQESEKQKSKVITNAHGYYDIRLHLLNQLFPNGEDAGNLFAEAEASLCRQMLVIADQYNDLSLRKEYYAKLKAVGLCNEDDKIRHYAAVSPPLSCLMRIKRKFRKWIRSC